MKKIKKRIKVLLENKFVAYFVIPSFLLGFWLLGATLFNNKISFSVLTYKNQDAFERSEIRKKLFKGDKVTGEFKAKDNYLGLILINFENFIKPDFRGEDVLAFRVKENGAKEWYYYNNYRSGLLQDELQFPFGFPSIAWSKGKTYQFEIESLFGNDTNAVSIANTSIYSASQMPRAEIAGSKRRLVDYVIKKALVSFVDVDFLFSSILYLLPFLSYAAWRLYVRKLKMKNTIFQVLLYTFFIVEIFVLREEYLGVYLSLVSGWLLLIYSNKFKSKVSFTLGFLLLLLWVFLLMLNINGEFSKLNIWAYTFLAIGAFQAFLEERASRKA